MNRGGDRFVATPWEVGSFLNEDGLELPEAPTDWGLSVIFRDLNGDGLPDLYVCNDFVFWPDRIWLNQNSKRFQAAPRAALRCVSLSSMAVDVADINRDGFDDIFLADMLSQQRDRAWRRPDTLRENCPMALGRPGIPARSDAQTRCNWLAATARSLRLLSSPGFQPLTGHGASIFLDVDLDGWRTCSFPLAPTMMCKISM
jgi:hypothetical protein